MDVFRRCKLDISSFNVRHKKCLVSFQRFLLFLVLGQVPLPACVLFRDDLDGLLIDDDTYRNFCECAGIRFGEGLVGDCNTFRDLDKMLIICARDDFNVLHVFLLTTNKSDFCRKFVDSGSVGSEYVLVPVLHFNLVGQYVSGIGPVLDSISLVGMRALEQSQIVIVRNYGVEENKEWDDRVACLGWRRSGLGYNIFYISELRIVS